MNPRQVEDGLIPMDARSQDEIDSMTVGERNATITAEAERAQRIEAKISELEAGEPVAETFSNETEEATSGGDLLMLAWMKLGEEADEARSEGNGREMALAVTKIEECLLWYGRHQQLALAREEQAEAARAEGNARDTGVVLPEEPELIVVGDSGRVGSETAGEDPLTTGETA